MNIDVVEPLERIHHRPLKPLGRRLDAQRPCHDVDVILVQQRLEPAQLLLDPFGVALVETRVILDAHGTGFSVPTERTLEARRFPNPHGHTNTY